jgi:hypothetical protein
MVRRLVRTNITQGLEPSQWEVVLPEHEKDILTGSTALKVGRHPLLASFGVYSIVGLSGLHGIDRTTALPHRSVP